MQKTFEFIGGILVVIFMAVVFHQAVTQNKRAELPPAIVTTPVEQLPVAEESSVNNQINAADFAFALQEAVRVEIGQPIEGYEPAMFMQVFPLLQLQDFDGVEALIGHYEYRDGELVHEIGDVEMIHSAAPALSEFGMETLLDNVIKRLELDPDTTTVEKVVERLKYSSENVPSDEAGDDTLVACTMDAMQCPDGSFVGRVGPDCQFEACPTEAPSPEVTYCDRSLTSYPPACDSYEPVCGLVEVQCVTTPCNPVLETFPNSCSACANGNVLSYTDGACLNLQ